MSSIFIQIPSYHDFELRKTILDETIVDMKYYCGKLQTLNTIFKFLSNFNKNLAEVNDQYHLNFGDLLPSLREWSEYDGEHVILEEGGNKPNKKRSKKCKPKYKNSRNKKLACGIGRKTRRKL